ncbi:hypothetical protein [Ensifer sp. LCM 4579]|uniref:hypothetical protein n=1 Tax=Ensifer sp. LCM 4579 TaxID=1848292 RepID=UPI0010421EC5|nr:hypothetical protein [Ensifer sp. LCM 4579]
MMTTTRQKYEFPGEVAPSFARYGLQNVNSKPIEMRSAERQRPKNFERTARLNLATNRTSRNNALPGWVAERFKAPVLKTGAGLAGADETWNKHNCLGGVLVFRVVVI